MADTVIEIPAFVTRAMPLVDLAHVTADLLQQAEHHALPAPTGARVSQGGQEISLSFSGSQDSFHALARWADRFGGTVTGEPYTRDDGQDSVHCQVKFPYQGANVEAYAFVTAGQASTT